MQALGLVWGEVDTPSYEPDEQSMPLAAPVHFGARLLLEYWEERAAHGGIVLGRDVPSRKLSSILRNLAVYEPLEGDFRIRLAGAAFLRRFGRDVGGARLSELFDGRAFERRRDNLLEILRTGRPAIHDVQLPQRKRAPLHFEALALPALSPTRSTGWLLGGMFFHDWAR
jgi:hypothetical protein